MGVLRGGLLVIFGVLFFLGLLVQGFFLIVYLSLDYNTLKPQLSSVASGLLEKQVIPSNVDESYIRDQVSSMIEDKYYRDYDCNFFDCVKKTGDSFSLVSKHAQDYWRAKFLSFLIISLALLAAVFLLVENKSNFFFISSALFIISSFAFFKLEFIMGVILKPLFSVWSELGNLSLSSFLELFSVFLVKSQVVFVYFLGIGVLLLVVGLIMKLFGIGFEISGVIDKISGWFKRKSEIQPVAQSKVFEKTTKKSATRKKRL